jgi:hypothetical protein
MVERTDAERFRLDAFSPGLATRIAFEARSPDRLLIAESRHLCNYEE